MFIFSHKIDAIFRQKQYQSVSVDRQIPVEWKAGIANAGKRTDLSNGRGRRGSVFEHGQTYYAGRLSDNVFLIASHDYIYGIPTKIQRILCPVFIWNIHSNYEVFIPLYASIFHADFYIGFA